MTESISLNWSAPYRVATATRSAKTLPGDKILLPPSALEQLLTAATTTVLATDPPLVRFDPFNPYSLSAVRHERGEWRDAQQQLPHPLTFRLVNPRNGNAVYAGVREFSADENEIGLSPFLQDALGVKQNVDTEQGVREAIGNLNSPIDLVADDVTIEEPDHIMVHAKQLPKGTYVRLRPLEAGYNPEDWKSLLERHLRENYTTLTNGEVLTVPSSRNAEFRFVVDKVAPEGDGICVVDTDLEVDIEALNEEQARETLKQIMSKAQPVLGTVGGSSVGGILDIWKPIQGQVLEGEYVDYELPSWDRTGTVEIEISIADDEEVDLFVNPFSTRQRARPRDDEHVFADFASEVSSKRIRLQASNIELEEAEALNISVHAYGHPGASRQTNQNKLRHFSLRARVLYESDMVTHSDEAKQNHSPDDQKCKNCLQWVPARTIMLHENFCFRNNVVCPRCSIVFKKTSPEWASHWHCRHDDAHGTCKETLLKHNHIFHTSILCPNCPFEALSLPTLAHHRTTTCPGKLILCKFCHLSVPQEGDPFDPSPESIISGLTAHELADGSRTTNCHLCQVIVRLRDMDTHLKHHDLSRQSRPLPRICRNVNCGRTLDGVGKNGDMITSSRIGQGPENELGLCSICFGPLYVNTYDPDGRAMRRRIERRYISQLIQGCGKSWCANRYCKFGRVQIGVAKEGGFITAKEALPMVKPLMEDIISADSPMYLCVDERSQMRRKAAELIAEEGEYDLHWCIAACDAEGGNIDRARSWLQDQAPRRGEKSY